MKVQHAVAVIVALSAGLWSSAASAQRRETVTTTGPNRAMLRTGIFAFGVSYIPSVIVAAESYHSGDKSLYIPVAGPWMDLADRGTCGNLGQPSCDTETAYKVLLVVDGIFQGIGALDIMGAFVFPETRTVTISSGEPHVRVAPAYWGRNGYGFSALATF